MGVLATVCTALIVALLLVREWLLRSECAPRPGEPFDGHVYRVGKAAIAERRSENPRATVICMHGFVENLHYFTHHYRDEDVQLILVNSCDYHVPIADPVFREAPWASGAPAEREGSIRYDAAVLLRALEHLPRSPIVRVHGHSRGGAVVLEATSMRPELFKDVEVLLEAPVLPQAKVRGALTAIHLWFLAFVVPLWRRQPISPWTRGAYGPLEDERKKELMESLPFNPKRISTLTFNVKELAEWMVRRNASIYAHLESGTVLVPGKDRVLDHVSMHESASKAGSTWRVIEVEGCSHFVLWDRPDAVPALAGSTERVAAR